MTSYKIKFNGSCEAINEMTRAFDRAFRALYNVHGGKRIASERAANQGYSVVMEYTANWINWSGYRFESVVHIADTILNSHNFKWSNGRYELGA